MDNHSPLPWKLDGTRIVDANGKSVALAVRAEDAAFIVLAANATEAPNA